MSLAISASVASARPGMTGWAAAMGLQGREAAYFLAPKTWAGLVVSPPEPGNTGYL